MISLISLLLHSLAPGVPEGPGGQPLPPEQQPQRAEPGPEGPSGQPLLLKQRPHQAAQELPPQSLLVPVDWPPTVMVCPVLFPQNSSTKIPQDHQDPDPGLDMDMDLTDIYYVQFSSSWTHVYLL